MKHLLTPLVAALVALPALQAEPLNRRQIAADARWVLHLDADALRKTTLGAQFMSQVLDPKSAQGKADLKRELGFDLDWTKVRSITAYGATFQPQGTPDPTAVLLIHADLDAQAALDQAIARSLAVLRVQKIESASGPVYALNGDAHVAFPAKGLAVVSKSREIVESARKVVAGSAANLAASNRLGDLPPATAGFFFLGVAEGFAEQASLPPNAAVIKNARGAQLRAGEAGDRLDLELTIMTVSAETARQVQQVAQGLVALAGLSGNQNPEAQALAQSAAVSTSGSAVTIKASLPTATVLRKLAEGK